MKFTGRYYEDIENNDLADQVCFSPGFKTRILCSDELENSKPVGKTNTIYDIRYDGNAVENSKINFKYKIEFASMPSSIAIVAYSDFNRIVFSNITTTQDSVILEISMSLKAFLGKDFRICFYNNDYIACPEFATNKSIHSYSDSVLYGDIEYTRILDDIYRAKITTTIPIEYIDSLGGKLYLFNSCEGDNTEFKQKLTYFHYEVTENGRFVYNIIIFLKDIKNGIIKDNLRIKFAEDGN